MLLGYIDSCLSGPLSFSSPSEIPITCMLVIQIVYADGVPHILGPVYFLFVFLSVLRLGNFNYPVFKFAHSFFCLTKSVEPSSNFISVNVLFTYKLSIWFFKISISLLILYFYFVYTSFSWLFLILCLWFPLTLRAQVSCFISHLFVASPVSGLPQGQYQFVFVFQKSHIFMFFKNTSCDFFCCCWKLDSLIL